ncbi:MAG: FtsX-like permease family protein, partial [Rhodothermales bacterium]|nr:FtsX-like permease family protein [Rhodothermales bacterium]
DVRADSDWTFGLRGDRRASGASDVAGAPRYDDPAFQWYGMTPGPLGPAVADSSPDIVDFVRIVHTRGEVIHDGESLGLNIRFVDENFFDVFSFPLDSGTATAVRRSGEVLLSADQAERFFGETDPIGRALAIRYGDDDVREFTVTGVAAPFRSNADLKFDALMTIGAAEQVAGRSTDDWSTFDTATFLRLRSADVEPRVETQMASFAEPVNSALATRSEASGPGFSADEPTLVHSFALDNLKDLTRHKEHVEDSIIGHLPLAPIVILGGLSTLLLLLACFNYMNITIAQATKRLREIGVRKVIGANRAQVAFQFLAENILLCLFALLFGLLLAWSFVLPAFNGIASLNLEFALLSDWRLWIFLGALVLGTGMVSGFYPALHISSFRPTIIFRGMDRTGGRRPLTTAFQGFQFMLAFLTLAAGVTLVLNNRYYVDRSAGYDTNNTIVFSAGSTAEMDVLRSAAAQTPLVTQWTTVENAFERFWREELVDVDGNGFESVVFGISRAYPEMMGLETVAGRMPTTDESTFAPEHVLVNRAFVQRLGDMDPSLALGRIVRFDSTDYEIAGVTENFHYEDFFSVIEPALLRIVPETDHRFLVVSSAPAERRAVADRIAARYEAAFPDRSADYYLQGDMFDRFHEESIGLTAIFLFVAILALIISCLSIYALSAQNVLNRIKEVGVRKV